MIAQFSGGLPGVNSVTNRRVRREPRGTFPVQVPTSRPVTWKTKRVFHNRTPEA